MHIGEVSMACTIEHADPATSVSSVSVSVQTIDSSTLAERSQYVAAVAARTPASWRCVESVDQRATSLHHGRSALRPSGGCPFCCAWACRVCRSLSRPHHHRVATAAANRPPACLACERHGHRRDDRVRWIGLMGTGAGEREEEKKKKKERRGKDKE